MAGRQTGGEFFRMPPGYDRLIPERRHERGTAGALVSAQVSRPVMLMFPIAEVACRDALGRSPMRTLLVPTGLAIAAGLRCDVSPASEARAPGRRARCALRGSVLVQHDARRGGRDARRRRIELFLTDEDLGRPANAVLGFQTRSHEPEAAPLRGPLESLQRELQGVVLLGRVHHRHDQRLAVRGKRRRYIERPRVAARVDPRLIASDRILRRWHRRVPGHRYRNPAEVPVI